MSKNTIGGKTKAEWQTYLMLTTRVAQVLMDSMREAADKGDKDAAEEIYKLYDAILNIYVLAEFVVDNHEWKEKKSKVQ